MAGLTNITKFTSVAEVRKYLSSPDLKLKRDGANHSLSMAQALARIQTEIISSGEVNSKIQVSTIRDARRFIEKIAAGDCCVITEENNGLSLELNCRSFKLADLLTPYGLIRIGRNTFKVNRNSVTLIQGTMKSISATAALFQEFGYPSITDSTAANKKTTSLPEIVWELGPKTVKQNNRRLPAFGHRATLKITQYADESNNIAYCVVDVTPQIRHWLSGFIPIWLPTYVSFISIGGAFSGPKSPTVYDLPNPFNHIVESDTKGVSRSHWRAKDWQYQVDHCTYDCSVYPYDGGRIDVDVWK